MDLSRRYVFHGCAVALSGRIVRPTDTVLETHAASSLPVVGGRSVSNVGGGQFANVVQFGSASTFAEGLADDITRGDSTTTRVHAEVREFAIGTSVRVTIARLHAALVSKSPRGSGQPAIRSGDESAIEGVVIGGHRLRVTLNIRAFQQYDTHAKLLAAADEPAFVTEHGDSLFMRSAFEGRPATAAGRFIDEHRTIHATLVRQIAWEGDPYPGASIDHHTVIIPDFGRLHFGELRITEGSRRLTLLRVRLGSPVGGDVAACDVETNGGWSP